MRFKLGLMFGFALGYYFGAKAGRARYEQMRVWLERYISGAATRFFAGDIERDCLGVFYVFEDIKTFTCNLTRRTDDDTTDKWPRTDLPDALQRQIERTRHHAAICVGPDCRFSYGRLHVIRIIRGLVSKQAVHVLLRVKHH